MLNKNSYNCNSQRRNVIHEINWNQPEDNNAAVLEKVNHWLMSHEKTETRVESDITTSPVFNQRKRFKSRHENYSSDASALITTKTPSSADRNYLPSESTSPIVRKKSFAVRKSLFQLKDQVLTLENSSENILPKAENVTSPVVTTKRHSFRKKERSFSSSKGSIQIPDTMPLKMENIENSPSLEIDQIKTENSFDQIDMVESENEADSEKENLIMENDSFVSVDDKFGQHLIEDQYSQEIERAVDISINLSQNSDETYYSKVEDGESLLQMAHATDYLEEKKSTVTPEISQVSSYSAAEKIIDDNESLEKKKSNINQEISQVSSCSFAEKTVDFNRSLNFPSTSKIKFNFNNASIMKKRKKSQKSSLWDRLQNLVGSAASFNRMWHHQMRQPQFRESQKQFIVLSIKNTYPYNERQIFECQILKDENNLLKTLLQLTQNNKNVNVIVVPEIVGSITISHISCMKLYPPLKVIDKKCCLIEGSHFIFKQMNLNNDSDENENIQARVEKFDCLCLQKGIISKDCHKKFENCKPNVLEAIFDS